MLRTIVLLIVGIMIGAAGFHVYYLGLAASERCRWDHPLDQRARALCEAPEPAAYSNKARREMDELIGNVSVNR